MKKKNIWVAFIILLSILIIFGVFIGLILKGGDKAPESADGILIKDNVSVITDETPIDQQPLKVAEDELVFRVNPHYSKDEIIVAGILDSASAGFIRKVVETIKEGNQYIVKTETGVLTDVFEKVHIIKTFALTEDGVKEADGNDLKQAGAMYKTEKMSYIPSASRSRNTDIINIVNTMSLSNDNTDYPFYKEFEYAITQEVSVSGAVGFHVWIEVELDVHHGEVIFGVTAHNESEGEIFFGCHADAKMKFEEELFSKDLPDFEFFIGVIPIVITNEIQAGISGEIELEGSIGTSFEIQSENSSGFLYSSKTNEVKEIREKKYLSDGLQWNTEARFSGENTVNVLLHLITKLYDSTGADLSVGIEGKNKGEVRVSPQKSLDGLNYAGSIDLSVSPKLQGNIVVSIPVIDQKLAEVPIFEVKLKPFWEKHWDSGEDWEKELERLEADNAPKEIELNHTYTTKFGEVNAITYPKFMFDYPDNWSITQEEVIPMGENVTLTNERGIEIKFSHIGGVAEGDFERGGSTTDMLRVEVSPVADSSFIPGYVQATDYSELGKFTVAKLETTGHIDMIKGTDFTEVHGETAYAVLPESKIGTDDDVRHPFHAEFAFWYSDYISFVANSPDGQFTEQEEKEVLAILSSFRTE